MLAGRLGEQSARTKHKIPVVLVFETAAEEGGEPLQAELLDPNAAAVGVVQSDSAPLQVAADVIHERPKGKGVLDDLMQEDGGRQMRGQEQAAREQVLHQPHAVHNAQLDITGGGRFDIGQKHLLEHA